MKELYLRQICLVASDKEQTAAEFATLLDMPVVHGSGDLSSYGLPARGPMFEGGHQVLEALGVENLIFRAGSDFVEVLFPTRPNSSAARLMQRRGGSTGYMMILQSDDVDCYRESGEKAGIRVIHEAHYPKYRDVHFHPKDTGAALLSVARHMPENVVHGPWYPAGVAWEDMGRSGQVQGLAAADLQSADPSTLATRWGQILGRPVDRRSQHFEIALNDSRLRFEKGDEQQAAFSGFEVKVADQDKIRVAAQKRGALFDDMTIRVCGMRVTLVQE